MDTIFEREMLRNRTSKGFTSSNKKRQHSNGEGSVSRKRRKGKGGKRVVPLGELSRQEEERLEKIVLGDGSDFLHDEFVRPSHSFSSAMEQDSGVEEGNCESSPQMSDTLASPERQPAWEDEDEDVCVAEAMEAQGRQVPEVLPGGTSSSAYKQVLKHKFEILVGNPDWAQLGNTRKSNYSDEDSDSDTEILKHCGNTLSRSSALLKKTVQIKRMSDLNKETYLEGNIIKAVEFHKTSSVALVAGVSGIASLFQVDGRSNAKLQSVQFEHYPINCAHFTPSGEQFIVGSRHHRHFYTYDMMEGRSIKGIPSSEQGITNTKNFKISPDGRLIALCGRFGNIHLLTTNSMEGVGLLKMNNDVLDIEFDEAGSRMFSHGEGGEVYAWDIGARRCLGRFIDDGCITGRSLAVSPEGRFLACGARSGVVNIYETAGLLSSARNAPTPAKILMNLTTPATKLKFNSSAEILAIASNKTENALRLVHFPSMTVFINFPNSTETRLGEPKCLDFSPGSGFLAVGSNKKRVSLFRLKHYGNY